jgi:hypothetical protein
MQHLSNRANAFSYHRHGMRFGFGRKHGFYSGPKGFEKIAVPVIVQGSFGTPPADGEENMRLCIVLVSIQFEAALKLGNSRFVVGKSGFKRINVLGLQGKLDHSGK